MNSCNDYSRRKGAEVILIALLLAITPQSSMQDPRAQRSSSKENWEGKRKTTQNPYLSD